MKKDNNLNITQRELLIRLDERVSQLQTQMTVIQSGLISPAEHKGLMKSQDEFNQRIDSLEQWKSRLSGQISIFSVVGGVAAGLVTNLVGDILKRGA